jgi:multiple sugar transport system permease protein
VSNPRTRVTSRFPMAAGLLWISPWIVGCALFLLLPAVLSAYDSFTDYSLLERPVFVGMENYREMAGDHVMWIAIRNTLLYSIASVAGSTAISVALAVLLDQHLRGAALVRAIVFLPTLVPVVSAAVCWLWLFNPSFGLFNSAMKGLGISGPDWLGDRSWALPSLVMMSLWMIGSPLLVCSAALKDVPRTLYEAADIDGVSAIGRFRHVTLPMISPAVLFNAVMSLIWSAQVFAQPQIMTKGGPQYATMVYSLYVYLNAFVYGRMGYACALAWMQMVATLVLAIALVGLSRRFVYYRVG